MSGILQYIILKLQDLLLYLIGLKLTSSCCFALADRLHDTDATAGLQRGLEPVRGVVNIGHVDSQASILTEKNHGCALLFITGSVSDCYHILNLGNKETY